MSGETKFTPGPWKAAASGSSIVGWPVVAPKDMGRMICNVSFAAHSPTNPAVPGDQAFNAESKANAHLIAASPELYAENLTAEMALRELANILEGTQLSGCASIARAHADNLATVAAKARGESQ